MNKPESTYDIITIDSVDDFVAWRKQYAKQPKKIDKKETSKIAHRISKIFEDNYDEYTLPTRANR